MIHCHLVPQSPSLSNRQLHTFATDVTLLFSTKCSNPSHWQFVFCGGATLSYSLRCSSVLWLAASHSGPASYLQHLFNDLGGWGWSYHSPVGSSRSWLRYVVLLPLQGPGDISLVSRGYHQILLQKGSGNGEVFDWDLHCILSGLKGLYQDLEEVSIFSCNLGTGGVKC